MSIHDSMGCLDGTTTSIELASRFKYKLIRHHLAIAYYERGSKNTSASLYKKRKRLHNVGFEFDTAWGLKPDQCLILFAGLWADLFRIG